MGVKELFYENDKKVFHEVIEFSEKLQFSLLIRTAKCSEKYGFFF